MGLLVSAYLQSLADGIQVIPWSPTLFCENDFSDEDTLCLQFVLENPEDDVLDYGILEEADIVTKTFTLHNPNPIRVSSRKGRVVGGGGGGGGEGTGGGGGRGGGRQGGRGGRGRKGGKADIIYIKLAAKRKQSYYWTNLHPWSSHVQSVAQRGSHQLPVQRSEEEKEVITNRTTQEAVVGMGAQQVACFNNIQTYTCTPPY